MTKIHIEFIFMIRLECFLLLSHIHYQSISSLLLKLINIISIQRTIKILYKIINNLVNVYVNYKF